MQSAEWRGEILKTLKILKMLKFLGPALPDYRASMLINNECNHTIISKSLLRNYHIFEKRCVGPKMDHLGLKRGPK